MNVKSVVSSRSTYNTWDIWCQREDSNRFRKIGVHMQDASPEDSQRGKAIPWTDRILPKVRTSFC